MTEKSHVSLEQNVCSVCGTTFDTNAILLDRRLRQSLERHTVTGWGFCPEHEKLKDEGYVALIEVDNGYVAGENLKQEEANRTGHIGHVKRDVWNNIFNSPAPESPIVFVEKGVLDKLQRLATTD